MGTGKQRLMRRRVDRILHRFIRVCILELRDCLAQGDCGLSQSFIDDLTLSTVSSHRKDKSLAAIFFNTMPIANS